MFIVCRYPRLAMIGGAILLDVSQIVARYTEFKNYYGTCNHLMRSDLQGCLSRNKFVHVRLATCDQNCSRSVRLKFAIHLGWSQAMESMFGAWIGEPVVPAADTCSSHLSNNFWRVPHERCHDHQPSATDELTIWQNTCAVSTEQSLVILSNWGFYRRIANVLKVVLELHRCSPDGWIHGNDYSSGESHGYHSYFMDPWYGGWIIPFTIAFT